VRVKFSRATVNIEQMGANLLDDMYEQKASNLKQVISRRNKMGAKHIAIIVRT
jgi:UTP-glucose-1-phosphate uridylyltransferase